MTKQTCDTSATLSDASQRYAVTRVRELRAAWPEAGLALVV